MIIQCGVIVFLFDVVLVRHCPSKHLFGKVIHVVIVVVVVVVAKTKTIYVYEWMVMSLSGG